MNSLSARRITTLSILRQGFTLIELLVVITIIVVLLALLTPALDRALYRTELLLCTTQQRTIVTSLQQYAMSNNRRYPKREATGKNGIVNTAIAWLDINTGIYHDDRAPLRPFMDVNLLVDPMTEPVDLANTDPVVQSTILSGYNLYYGWRFTGVSEAAGASRMKLGDAFSFDGQRLPVMTACWDRINAVDVESLGSHPDHGGIRVSKVKHDDPADTTDGDTLPVGIGIVSQVGSWWDNRVVYQRPTVDTNAAFDDGSAATTEDVHWDEWQRGSNVVKLPEFVDSNGFYVNWHVLVPGR